MKKTPKMFHEFRDFRKHRDRRNYVSRVLESLAQEGSLYLTDALNQPEDVAAYVRMVCNGHDIDANRMCVQGQRVPSAIANFKVKLKAINGHKLQWKHGEQYQDRDNYVVSGEAHTTVDFIEPVIYDFGDAKEVEVTPAEAISALMQCGENVRRCRNTRIQKEFWHLTEVRPEGAKKAKAA